VKYGMVVDLEKCLGCRTCAVACKAHNAQPPGVWWNRVFTPGSKFHQTGVGEYGRMGMYFLPVSCQMCRNAPCVKVCPVGATYTDDRGIVLIDYERCIGCRYCMTACPYGVRQFNWQDGEKAREKIHYTNGYSYGWPEKHRDKQNRLVYMPSRPKGIVEKCTFCVQYVDKGELPACVRSCPANARYFGDLDDPRSEVSKLLTQRGEFRLLEDAGTQPKVYYLPAKQGGGGQNEGI